MRAWGRIPRLQAEYDLRWCVCVNIIIFLYKCIHGFTYFWGRTPRLQIKIYLC